MQIVALIHETDGVYRASFPDFPECTVRAADVQELLVRAAANLRQHIDDLIAAGRAWPQPHSLSRLASDPAFLATSTEAMIALIPYTPRHRLVNVNLTFDESLLAAVDRAATAAGQSRSEYLSEAARRKLHQGCGTSGTEPLEEGAGSAIDVSPAPTAPAPAEVSTSLRGIRDILERLDSGCGQAEPHGPAQQAG